MRQSTSPDAGRPKANVVGVFRQDRWLLRHLASMPRQDLAEHVAVEGDPAAVVEANDVQGVVHPGPSIVPTQQLPHLQTSDFISRMGSVDDTDQTLARHFSAGSCTPRR
jgi:hypothetical protein